MPSMLYLIFARLCACLVLLSRSTASKDTELLVLRALGQLAPDQADT